MTSQARSKSHVISYTVYSRFFLFGVARYSKISLLSFFNEKANLGVAPVDS